MTAPTYSHVRVQYHDGAGWVDFGSPQDLSTALRTRRFAQSEGVTAQRWRVVGFDADASGGTVSVGGLAMYSESDLLSPARQVPFAFSADQYYSIWLSVGNGDVFANGQFLASVPLPYSADELPRVTYVQSLDTLILYHPNHAPRRVMRSGQHTAWDSRPQTYLNEPLIDYTGAALNGENAQQQLIFSDYLANDYFNIEFAGETTRTIIYSTNVAVRVREALLDLKNLKNGDVTVTHASDTVTIEFIGGNGNREWPEMIGRTVRSDTGGVVGSTLARGKKGGEPQSSDTRGYARCGSFWQQRLFQAGFRSRPSTLGSSVAGDYFNMDTDLTSADVGLDFTLDGTNVVEIRHLIAGREMMVFTASGEFYIPAGAITRDSAQIRMASAVGCSDTIRPIVVDGPALFIERRSGALRAFVFNDQEQSYVPEIISMHASHLLPAPIDMARRPARTAKEADLIVIPNAAGAPTVLLTLLRQHAITAFTRMTTAGDIIAVGVENDFTAEVAVERDGEVWLEYMDDACLLDASTRIASDPAGRDSYAVPDLDGQTVTVMEDGAFAFEADVIDGVVTFPRSVIGAVEIGLPFNVEFKTLPVRRSSEEGGFRKKRYRIVKAQFDLVTCPAFEVAANGTERFYQYRPQRPGELILDRPLPLFNAPKEIVTGPGSTVRPDLHFRLLVPGRVHLRSLDMEMSE